MRAVAILCHCLVVREGTIREAIDCGAVTLAEIQAACGAATGCGGCTEALRDLLVQHGRSIPLSAVA